MSQVYIKVFYALNHRHKNDLEDFKKNIKRKLQANMIEKCTNMTYH